MGAICSCFKGKKKEEGMKDIKRNRSCTDSIFCILFGIALVVAAIIIIVGMSNGNIESLYYGTDSTGMTCGSQNNNLKTNENIASFATYLASDYSAPINGQIFQIEGVFLKMTFLKLE